MPVCLSVSFVGLELEQKTGNSRRNFLEPGADVQRGPAVRGELRGRRLVPTCQTLGLRGDSCSEVGGRGAGAGDPWEPAGRRF